MCWRVEKSSLLPEGVYLIHFLSSKGSNCSIALNLKITANEVYLVTKNIFSYLQLCCVSVSPH